MTDLVALDIGGTHARFALARIAPDGAIALDDPITLATGDYASLQTAWCSGVTSGTSPKPATRVSGVTTVRPGHLASRRSAARPAPETRETSRSRPRSTARTAPPSPSSQRTRAPQAAIAAA